MNMLLNSYTRLLTDIRVLTGIRLDLPDDFSMNWVLIEGPELDSKILRYIDDENYPALLDNVPQWLKPLCLSIFKEDNWSHLMYLRTLLNFGYKSACTPSEKQRDEAVSRFLRVNEEVRRFNIFFDEELRTTPLFREARAQISSVIGRCDYTHILPSHGPGAVFPRSEPWNKSNFVIRPSITRFYPYDDNFNCLPILGDSDKLAPYEPDDYPIVAKLLAVPKDSRGPRLISVHPKESIWIQQGQRHIIESAISHHKHTAGRISFQDQSVNGALALSSSADRAYCTIDLKDASDRLGCSLIKFLFGNHHYDILGCSRASNVLLPNGTTETLHMFAPMGNCLTFPIESIVFWSLVRAGIRMKYGEICTNVYVFGDDIIVPTKYYEGAVYGLEAAGLMINMRKTFTRGFFRESCGVDAFHGINVTPFRCRVQGVSSFSEAISVCDLAKRLRRQGFVETSSYLYSYVSRAIGKRLVLSNNPDAQGIYEYVDKDIWWLLRNEPSIRLNAGIQCYEVPILNMTPVSNTGYHHAWWHVQDSLLRLSRESRFGTYGAGAIFSERGLEYLSQGEMRLRQGWSQVLVPPSVPWVFLHK